MRFAYGSKKAGKNIDADGEISAKQDEKSATARTSKT
jgi:hypothetical protein